MYISKSVVYDAPKNNTFEIYIIKINDLNTL